VERKTWIESLPHPSGLIKWLYKSPILFYRLGLGSLVGRLFMVMTTTGRKSGQPRRTAIEFHEFKGRKFVLSGWSTQADWFRNIEANPYITIQTWRGAERVFAHKLTSEAELSEAFEFAMSNPSMRMVMKSVGFNLTREQFLVHKDRFTFVTFDPTDQATPEPLLADLVWTWYILLPFVLYLTVGLVFLSAAKWLGREAGYLIGFAFYWLVFGLAIPAVAAKGGLGELLTDRSPLFSRQNWVAAVLWVAVTGIALVMYGMGLISAPLNLILLSIPLATLNGFCEEIFWRGLYIRVFPRNPWLAVVYPAICFALWHFIPLRVLPDETTLVFVFSTLFLGLAYGFIAYRTGSAKWTAISHSLNGILALSGSLALSFLHLFGS
jgi:deazaflavin-dependent oxidoreductase (nitroreductase family)